MFNESANGTFIIIFGFYIFIVFFCLASSRIGKKHASITGTITLLLTGLLFGGVTIFYGNAKSHQVETQLEASSKTLTVETLESKLATSGLNKDFIIVNGEYKIATDVALPKGATITIQKYQSEPYYHLVKYEIK